MIIMTPQHTALASGFGRAAKGVCKTASARQVDEQEKEDK